MTDKLRASLRAVKGVPGGDVSPIAHDFTLKRDILCPMRDGLELAMDLLIPDGEGPFPVILV